MVGTVNLSVKAKKKRIKNEGCRFGAKCAFLHPDTEAPSMKSNRKTKSEKMTLAFVRSNQNLGCASQDVELPEQTVGLTNENRSILKKHGKLFAGAHLEFKCTKTAESFNRNSGTIGTISGSYPR